MNRYEIRLHARPELRYAPALIGAQTPAEALASTLDGIGAISSRPAELGGDILQLALNRPNRDQAFNEVAAAVQQLGYSVLEAEVSKIVDKSVAWAVRGFLGAGTIGSTTKKPSVALLAAAIGAAAGAAAGSMVQTISTSHRYQWFPSTGWVVTEPPIEAARQPDPAAARAATTYSN